MLFDVMLCWLAQPGTYCHREHYSILLHKKRPARVYIMPQRAHKMAVLTVASKLCASNPLPCGVRVSNPLPSCPGETCEYLRRTLTLPALGLVSRL